MNEIRTDVHAPPLSGRAVGKAFSEDRAPSRPRLLMNGVAPRQRASVVERRPQWATPTELLAARFILPDTGDMMDRGASVSALVFHHPDARYFRA